jgi:hypothetical protein
MNKQEMGLLDNVFGGKQKAQGNLVDGVVGMRQQGVPDAAIAQQMQAQGVPLPQIQDAMTQADIKMRVSGQPPGMPGPDMTQPLMAPPMGGPEMSQQMQMGQMGQMGGGMMPSEAPSGPSSEEIIERIIDDKWHVMQDKFDKFEESKSELLRQMQDLRDNLNDLRVKYAQLQEDSVVKIEEYNKELEGVGSQIKAMQRVMQNMIPVFAENVRQLNDIVSDMKGGNSPPAPPAPPVSRQTLSSPPSPYLPPRQKAPPLQPEEGDPLFK